MRSHPFLLGLLVSLLVPSLPVMAEAGSGDEDRYGYDDDDDQGGDRSFRCESNGNRTVYCRVDAGQDVRFVRQHSRAACIEGESWGWDRGGVWVSGGCRAEFEISERRSGWGNGGGSNWNSNRHDNNYGNGYDNRNGDDGLVRCESNDARTVYCRAETRRGVRLANQLSRAQCIQGQSWGYDGRGIWVSQGCRAEFLLAGNNPGGYPGGGYGGYGGQRGSVTCESQDGRYVFCRAPRVRQAQLQRQLSRGACIEGQSWGFRSDGIWVSNGCRAEFSVY